jgi:stress-induced morphogen
LLRDGTQTVAVVRFELLSAQLIHQNSVNFVRQAQHFVIEIFVVGVHFHRHLRRFEVGCTTCYRLAIEHNTFGLSLLARHRHWNR